MRARRLGIAVGIALGLVVAWTVLSRAPRDGAGAPARGVEAPTPAAERAELPSLAVEPEADARAAPEAPAPPAAELETEPEPATGLRVRGRVLAPDGRPAPRARVAGRQFHPTGGGYGKSREHACAVDELGRFELAGLAPGELQLRATSPEHAPSEWTGLELVPGAEGDVVLQLLRAARITGELRDPAGVPLPVETVALSGEAAAETLTDSQGRFEFAGLAPGTYSLALAEPQVLTAEQLPIPSVSVTLADGEEKHVVLGAQASGSVLVRGLVTRRGAAVAAAEVQLQDGNEGLPKTTISDTDGRFVLHVARGGPRTLSISADAVVKSLFPCSVPEAGECELAFELPGAELRGTVVDPEGRALVGAALRLNHAERAPGAQRSFAYAHTSTDGSFALGALAPGEYTLAVQPSYGSAAPDLADLLQRLTLADDECRELRLVLPRGGRLHARVHAPDGTQWTELRMYGSTGLPLIEMFKGDGSLLSRPLAPGSYRLLARTEELASLWHDVKVVAGEDRELDLTLGPATRVEVLVVDEDGSPLAGRVDFLDLAGRVLDFHPRVGPRGAPSARSTLPPGDYELAVQLDDGRSQRQPLRLSGQPEEVVRIVPGPR
jgi:carboxypeptidase family protein